MHDVTAARVQATYCRHHEKSIKAQGRYFDPEALIEDGLEVEEKFVRMAAAAPDNVMRNVYLEMAGMYRRAITDAARCWRDVNG